MSSGRNPAQPIILGVIAGFSAAGAIGGAVTGNWTACLWATLACIGHVRLHYAGVR